MIITINSAVASTYKTAQFYTLKNIYTFHVMREISKIMHLSISGLLNIGKNEDNKKLA